MLRCDAEVVDVAAATGLAREIQSKIAPDDIVEMTFLTCMSKRWNNLLSEIQGSETNSVRQRGDGAMSYGEAGCAVTNAFQKFTGTAISPRGTSLNFPNNASALS